MATFYILPSRHQFGQRFGELVTSMFPGSNVTAWDCPDLAETFITLIEARGGAHVVYREDLDERISVKDALLNGFGAALDDKIIEIQFGPGLNQFLHQHWATEAPCKTSRAENQPSTPDYPALGARAWMLRKSA